MLTFVRIAMCFGLLAAPPAYCFQFTESLAAEQKANAPAEEVSMIAVNDGAAIQGSSGETKLEDVREQQYSNRTALDMTTSKGRSSALSHISTPFRAWLEKQAGTQDEVVLLNMLAPQSADGRPVLVPHLQNQRASRPTTVHAASLLDTSGKRGSGDFQPSNEFQAAGSETATSADQLPWGMGSPRTGDSLPVFQESSMPAVDRPKEWEYSLESGDTIRSFSYAQQDVKLMTQVLENVTNGFYLDSNAGWGEDGSNTLLFELAGWRGLMIEPRLYPYMTLWSKFRKGWLFLGCISPHDNSTKIGFDTEGNIDMLSGHQIHAHPMTAFMAEFGGRKTIDFWNLWSGGYEAEILNETLLGSGKFLEFGVILVRWDGRRTGRGWQPYVLHRSKDYTEEIIHEICYNASLKYIGGLDAYWINHVTPRFSYNDGVWVNPKYFEKRGIPTPTTIKAAPPPHLSYPLQDQIVHPSAPPEWDFGYTKKEEIAKVKAYIKKSKEDAAAKEPAPKAHRTGTTKLIY